MISARLDGELGGTDDRALDAHLQACAHCQAYQDDAFALRRTLNVRAVDIAAEPPVTPASMGIMGSLRGLSFLRWALYVIGGTLIIINLQSVFWAEDGTAAHLSRHDGVFGTALGIGMVAVAFKPQRAIGLVPLTMAIAVLMLAVAGADLLSGEANLLSEAIHIVQLAGLVCLWVISGGPTRLPRHLEAISSAVSSTLRRPAAGSVSEWPTV